MDEVNIQYLPMLLFIMLYKVMLTFESVDEIPKSFSVVRFIMLYKVVLTLRSLYNYNPEV